MAIWLARYHGGISFSLAVSLTFLALIVHQREAHKTSRPTEAISPVAGQVEPTAEPSHAPNVYAEKWRAIANEYYAKHPLLDDSSSQQVARDLPTSSSHNESRPLLAPSSSVQLASHQQSASRQDDASRSVADQPVDRGAVTATALQVVDAQILPARSVIAAIADLGIGGLFAGLSAAGIGFIVFHTVWPQSGKAELPGDSQSTSTPNIRLGGLAESDGVSELRVEIPAAWMTANPGIGERLRNVVVATSYGAIAVTLYILSHC